MADSKISNLPPVTTPSLTDVLPIVNDGTTKKVTVQNLASGFSSLGNSAYSTVNSLSSFWTPSVFIGTWSSAGTPGYRNMTDNTLNLINFNTTITNTDTSNYLLELGNANLAIDGKIRIQKTGAYMINLTYNTYDLTGGNFYSFYIYTNGTSKGTPSSHYSTIYDTSAPVIGTNIRAIITANGMLYVTTVPTWVSLVFRPTLGNPYPNDVSSGSTSQPPEVEIVKVY